MALDDPRPDALTLRYGADAPASVHSNPVIDQLLSHRSVRAYLPDPLPAGTIETLVAAAQSAATSSNLQLWSVVAVEDAARRERLAELAGGQKHIVEAPLILLWVADLARATLISGDLGEAAEGYDYLEGFTLAAIDAALAAQNAVVAAESLGLGTVYIGGLRNRPEDVAALAGLPRGAAVVFGLVVGHPDPARPAAVKPRLPQDVVLHHKAYALEAQREGIARFDETARVFQKEQGQNPVGWRALVAARGRNAATLNGRDRLKSALHALGFGLR
ncbi:nitroreductase family protein [Novosphingobium nitrogenifigens DSM 19370]|uniref:Nitroreductase family protein n=1 Tax=Novosphingobium nitrogenifigens DSM 19370 TaxID=983920 RepID=F1Z9P3_9SPHN|nr:nitroreductase family protein [Novosphingobium nitrogenifigens]EGD58699.1 nitroreductase family protein [Novosphingobium nitrogenifigens DSM 19370]